MPTKKEIKDAIRLIGEARTLIDQVRDEMDENFQEKSETWQDSDKGQEVSSQIAGLDDISGQLETASDELDSLFTS